MDSPSVSNESLNPDPTGRSLALLLFYSVLMFSLPFGAFFSTKYILDDFGIVGYTNTVWSVLSAVITVNLIIIAFAYQAYHEKEYDDRGVEIVQDSATKARLNLKED